MSAPSITSVSPTTGPTGGRRVIRIEGADFRLPPAPALSGVTTAPNPSVRVYFGTEEATEVSVLTTGKLNALLPPAAFDLVAGPGLVDVRVENVDQDGVLIGAETATATDAFTYARPQLNANVGTESILARVVRTIITKLRREVINNVELTVSTDYDDSTSDGADVAMLAALPGLVIVGPKLKENRYYSTNEPRKTTTSGRTFQDRPPMTVDAAFTIVGVDDSANRLINLQAETISFFQRNKTLRILRDATIPGDFVEYEMDHEDSPSWAGATNNSSLHVFNGSFLIRGIDIDEENMATQETFEIAEDGIILTGQPGTVTPAAPVQSNPTPAPGNVGPIEQIPPEE